VQVAKKSGMIGDTGNRLRFMFAIIQKQNSATASARIASNEIIRNFIKSIIPSIPSFMKNRIAVNCKKWNSENYLGMLWSDPFFLISMLT
jgi:hypothetical protein